MSVLRKLSCLAAGIGALMFVTPMIVTGAHAADGGGEFSGASFTCLQYTNGLGDNASGKMQTSLAQLWMLGYLAGYYKGQGKLEMSDNANDVTKLTNLMASRCKEFPQGSILGVSMQSLASEPHKIPKTTGTEFSPGTYTCGQHVDAKAGAAADANKADLGEMWAFAFIQGFKNVAAPNMAIGLENKPQLLGVINKACGSNRDTLYMDLTALVAEKVKLAN